MSSVTVWLQFQAVNHFELLNLNMATNATFHDVTVSTGKDSPPRSIVICEVNNDVLLPVSLTWCLFLNLCSLSSVLIKGNLGQFCLFGPQIHLFKLVFHF